ncbi:protein kinase [Streptosporangiaceae bacterium NEAU-GS5]|nr:protein kinase [Streptosporangiaceae bacterium NEAU-GS5]
MGSGGQPGAAPEGQGRLVGRRYRLLSPVGRGGMGMVWHAHDVLLDRDVAVKELILPFGLDHTGKQVAHTRVLREARSAARLSHPGIVTVHDVVEEDGRPWIVMELVRAWSLEQAVRHSGPLPVVQTAEIGVRVLDALRHAHAAGILHRDVKPGNVLLTADRVVLTDFGIAAIEGDVTITQTGLLMGSPAYIPPERLQGRPITHAADLWSFGATLYAAVEGRPPYEGPDAVAVLGAVLTQEPNRPQRAGALLPVIEGLLRKNPADRIGAPQVAEMLERVLRSHGAGLPGRPATVPTPTDSTPMHLLPPLDSPSGPLPSRIIETPSGPVRIPYDLAASPPRAEEPPPGARPGFDHFSPAGKNPQTTGPHASPQISGSHLSPQASGPHPNPHASGPHASGPHAGGPSAGGRGAGDPSASGPQAFGAPVQASSAPPAPGSASGFGAPPAAQDPFSFVGPAYDPMGSPSGSTHAPSREARDGMWPAPSATDLPGEWAREMARELSETRDGPDSEATNQVRRQVNRAPGERGHRGTGDSLYPSSKDEREGRSPVLLLVASVAVIAVVGALLYALFGGKDDPDSSTATSGVAAARPSATSSGQPPGQEPQSALGAPDGFKTETAGGVSTAVPKEWKASASGDVIAFTGPKDSGQSIVIEKIQDGSQAALKQSQQKITATDYTEVNFGKVNYRFPAYEWEYTYTNADKVVIHVVTRYVTTSSQAYSMTFTSPDFEWTESAAPVRKALWDTFAPTT